MTVIRISTRGNLADDVKNTRVKVRSSGAWMAARCATNVPERCRYFRYHDGSEEFYGHAEDPHEWKSLIESSGMATLIDEHRGFLPTTSHPVLGKESAGHRAYEASQKAEDL